MGSGNRNKVFFLPFLDQIFLQPLDSFHEMLVVRNFILKLDDRLTYPHWAPLKRVALGSNLQNSIDMNIIVGQKRGQMGTNARQFARESYDLHSLRVLQYNNH